MDTCKWALKHQNYLKWFDSNTDDLLWISADPGCGKSVLAKSLIDIELAQVPNLFTAYFFFREKDGNNNLSTALSSLLHQLLSTQRHLIKHALPAWEELGPDLTQNVSRLWRLLITTAKDSDKDITFVVDGLDECQPSERSPFLTFLNHFYFGAKKLLPRSNRLKFVITSRPHDDIADGFESIVQQLPNIRIDGENENDTLHEEINSVVKLHVNRLARELPLSLTIKDQLLRELLSMKHRTYLWLHLAIGNIRERYKKSLQPETAIIDLVPSTVDQAYEKILARVDKAQTETVKKIFQIIIGARRPSTVIEMAVALQIAERSLQEGKEVTLLEPDWIARRIREWCGLFVFISHERLYLIHQTAEKFLVRRENYDGTGTSWKHCLSTGEIEGTMARTCTQFLLSASVKHIVHKYEYQDFANFQNTLDRRVSAYLLYATKYWVSHLQKADPTTYDPFKLSQSPLYDTTSYLFKLSPFCETIEKTIAWYVYSETPPAPIFVAAGLGHHHMLEILLEAESAKNSFDIDGTDEKGHTLLMWACKSDDDEVVRMLLKRRANPNIGSHRSTTLFEARVEGGVTGPNRSEHVVLEHTDVQRSTPLYEASVRGREKIVEILLEAGADPRSTDNSKSPLEAAVFRAVHHDLKQDSAQSFEKIIAMLIKRLVQLGTGDAPDMSMALRIAVQFRNTQRMVQLLLNNGADPNYRDTYGETILARASDLSDQEVVATLLQARADVNGPSSKGSALKQACQNCFRYLELTIQTAREEDPKGKSVAWYFERYVQALEIAALLATAEGGKRHDGQFLYSHISLLIDLQAKWRRFVDLATQGSEASRARDRISVLLQPNSSIFDSARDLMASLPGYGSASLSTPPMPLQIETIAAVENNRNWLSGRRGVRRQNTIVR